MFPICAWKGKILPYDEYAKLEWKEINTMKLPVLYKRTVKGAVQQWQINVKGDYFYTTEGQLNGKLTESKPTYCEGKNIDKANKTSDDEQAIKQAQAKWKKKIEEGYTEDIDNIDTCKTTFTPMLAKKLVEYKNDITYPVLVSSKIDGLRLIARKDGLYTRNGKPFVSVPHISKILKPIFDKHPNWIIDSEIYSHEIPFEKIVSLVKKTKPTEEDLIESEKICGIYIFDGVTDDTQAGFEIRFAQIKSEIKNLIGKDKHLTFVENDTANSYDEIMKLHDQYVEKGWEGAMVRIPNSPYQNKRSKYLLKYKSFHDAEFPIVDIIEGIGSRAEMAGKIVVQLKSGETCEAGIKGGEEFYTELLKNRKQFIGKLATVRYQGFTEKGSLRFPVAVKFDPFDR
jgi:DNA ligase-1